MASECCPDAYKYRGDSGTKKHNDVTIHNGIEDNIKYHLQFKLVNVIHAKNTENNAPNDQNAC